jgi:hypothetical protein
MALEISGDEVGIFVPKRASKIKLSFYYSVFRVILASGRF